LVTKETKIILKKGYLVGRFFGVAWAIVFCITIGYTTFITGVDGGISNFTLDIQVQLYFIFLILFTEIFAPAIGIIAVLINSFIEKKFGHKTKTTFWTLFLTGIFFTIISIPILGAMESQESSLVNYYFFDSFIYPFIVPLFVAIVFFITNNELSKKQIKIHSTIRIITLFGYAGGFGIIGFVKDVEIFDIVFLLPLVILVLYIAKFKTRIFEFPLQKS